MTNTHITIPTMYFTSGATYREGDQNASTMAASINIAAVPYINDMAFFASSRNARKRVRRLGAINAIPVLARRLPTILWR